MGLFFKKRNADWPSFPPEDYEPVVRKSVCTGERVACMRDRKTGKLHEVMLLRTDEDLGEFCRQYRISAEELKTVY